MKTKKRVLLFLVATFIAVVSVSVAYANRDYSSTYVFFYDEDKTQVAGEGFTGCNWQSVILWGQQTDYYTEEQQPCQGSPCTEDSECGYNNICTGGRCTKWR